MSDDKAAGSNEGSLFRAAMRGVTRLETDTVDLESPRRRARPMQSRRDVAEITAKLDRGDLDHDHAGDENEFHRNGVQRTVLRRLRRGHYGIEDELDLHGLTAPEGKSRLAHFLNDANNQRLMCVRVIHGKGLSSPGKKPILKPKVARWLRASEAVLAYTAARPADGGSGALYVLLRRKGAKSSRYATATGVSVTAALNLDNVKT